MKIWMIAAVIAAVLVITGIVVSINAVSADEQETETIECSGCENRCTAERNCGLETCGAVSNGSCGCSK
jgi:hypothetical protein